MHFPDLSSGRELPVRMHRQARDVIVVAEEEALRVRLRAVHNAHPSREVNHLVSSGVKEVVGSVGNPAARQRDGFQNARTFSLSSLKTGLCRIVREAL